MSERKALLDSAFVSADDPPRDDAAAQETADGGTEAVDGESEPPRRSRRVRRGAVAVLVLATVALGATTGVLLQQYLRAEAARDLEQRYLQAARQSVLDLTTISAATVDEDVARVLGRSTGSFREQFDERSDDFVAVVQQADVQATGSITEVGIENADERAASVLVAATSSVSNSSGAQEEPRVWRLRITLENDGGSILVSDVEFVP